MVHARRFGVYLLAFAFSFGLYRLLWNWADGKQRESFWWFMLLWAPVVLTWPLAASVNDAIDRRTLREPRPGQPEGN